MRVAQIMAGAPTGGAELFFERLCIALAGAGETVLPVIRRDAGRAARLAAGGIPPVELGFGGALDLITGARLRRTVRRFAPSVAVAWMNRAARFAPTGDWVLAGRLGGYYDLRYYQACRHLIGNTRALVAWMRGQGIPAERSHYLPNFAPDLAGARPATLDLPPGPRLLALGRLHRNKAFDVLIRSLPRLPGVQAVIAGGGPEREALQALARREAVADRVHLPGWRTDTGALLAACDLLICPSRIEPLGNVVIEAWSARRPIVAADAAGPTELIAPERDGLLVAREDPGAIAAAVGRLLDDRPLATRLAEAGRTRYETEFAEAPVIALWRNFLHTVGNA